MISMGKLNNPTWWELFSNIRKCLKIGRIERWLSTSNSPISLYIRKSMQAKVITRFIGIDTFFEGSQRIIANRINILFWVTAHNAFMITGRPERNIRHNLIVFIEMMEEPFYHRILWVFNIVEFKRIEDKNQEYIFIFLFFCERF